MQFRKAYEASQDTSIINEEPSRTKQAFRDDVNINNIVKKVKRGLPVTCTNRSPMFGDFTDSLSFQEAQNQIIAAQAAFMDLPSHVRKRFNNDPAELLKFLEDPNNTEEAIKLGIAVEQLPERPPEAIELLRKIAEQGAPPETAPEPSGEGKKPKK